MANIGHSPTYSAAHCNLRAMRHILSDTFSTLFEYILPLKLFWHDIKEVVAQAVNQGPS